MAPALKNVNDIPGHDPRSVANLLLDLAEQRNILVTNLTLQKLLYFAHGFFLVSHRKPLVSGYFEAWTYGPVHPQVYDAFKRAGADPISFRVLKRDYVSGAHLPLPVPTDELITSSLGRMLDTLATVSTRRLVDLSHAKEGPWHHVVNEARTSPGLGLRISDNIIVERFHRHKVTVHGPRADGDDPSEDAPLT